MFGIPIWIGWLIGALVLAGGSAYEGWHEKSIRDQAALAAAQGQIIVQMGKSEVVTEQAAAVAETHQIAIVQFTSAILVEVPKYVTASDDAACTLHRGFVGLLNDAASGQPTVSAAPGQFDDSAAGVELHTVAASVAQNYGTCRAIRAQLIDLQGWVAAQQALADRKP